MTPRPGEDLPRPRAALREFADAYTQLCPSVQSAMSRDAYLATMTKRDELGVLKYTAPKVKQKGFLFFKGDKFVRTQVTRTTNLVGAGRSETTTVNFKYDKNRNRYCLDTYVV